MPLWDKNALLACNQFPEESVSQGSVMSPIQIPTNQFEGRHLITAQTKRACQRGTGRKVKRQRVKNNWDEVKIRQYQYHFISYQHVIVVDKEKRLKCCLKIKNLFLSSPPSGTQNFMDLFFNVAIPYLVLHTPSGLHQQHSMRTSS